jgi:ketosteroid isomerase-like protein
MSARHARYRAAAQAKDHAGVMACMAEDIRLFSPTKLKPFEGKAMASFLFGHLFEVLEDFRFTEEMSAQNGAATLFFTCRIGGYDAEGCDVLGFNAEGEIEDFRVLIRPLRAVEALNAAMGARLAARS